MWIQTCLKKGGHTNIGGREEDEDWGCAVSYTHLDVYKRQTLHWNS